MMKVIIVPLALCCGSRILLWVREKRNSGSGRLLLSQRWLRVEALVMIAELILSA